MDSAQNESENYFLQLTIQRLANDHRSIDDFLSILLPKRVEHEVYPLLPHPSENTMIITFRFWSNDLFDHARKHFDLIKSARYPFIILDICDVSPEETAIFPSDHPRKAQESLAHPKQRLIRILYEDEAVQTKVERHQQKIIDCGDDPQKICELFDQFDEFEKRRKCLEDQLSANGSGGKHRTDEAILQAFSLELRKFEAGLPIYAHRSQIKESIRSNRVCVIVADTGSGKSTQVPQYLLEMADDELDQAGRPMRILCTQPRKVAAISLANRVAEESNEEVGRGEVGYRVGGTARRCTDNTRLTFTTDAFLLRECLRDPLLKKYNYVIVDEAHERSLDTDLALGMLKRCLKQRPTDFRIIIMSATINPALFVDYFQDPVTGTTCSVLTIPGRCYPIEFHWAKDDSESAMKTKNTVETVVRKVKAICLTNKEANDGAILAFLTTPAETELASRLLSVENTDDSLWILQLHGRLQADDQKKVFDKCPTPEQRKVVFATNSAETSITIPDVRHVVDCGLVKERRFNAARNVSSLVVGWTSKSSATQRAGRAGRTGPGFCYRLYTEDQFGREMADHFVAEIHRTNMAQTLLYLFALQIDDPINFDFIEKPSADALRVAHGELVNLGALTEDGRQLTEVGKTMSKLYQVEPRLSRLLTMAAENEKAYLPETCALASCISVGNLFFRGGTDDQKNTADVCKVRFCDAEGDPISYLRVYDQWSRLRQQERGRWCGEMFINGKCMKAVSELVNELRYAIVRDARLAEQTDFDRPLNVDDPCASKLTKLFSRCYLSNLAMYTGHPRTGYYVPRLDGYVDAHPSSALNITRDAPAQWVTFEYVFQTSKAFAFNIAVVDENWLNEENIVEKSLLDDCRKRAVAHAPLNEFGWIAKRQLLTNKVSLEESAARIFNGALCFVETFQRYDPYQRLLLYAPQRCLEEMVLELRHQMAPTIDQLKLEFLETQIRADVSTRVCLAAGGEIQDILMRNEYRTVAIHNVPVNRSKLDDVLNALGIDPSWVLKNRIYDADPNRSTIEKWGILGLKEKRYAAFLVLLSENNDTYIARPNFFFNSSSYARKDEGFRVLISWCRRPSKGCGIIKLKTATDRPVAIFKLASKNLRCKPSVQRRNRRPGADPGENAAAENVEPPADDEIWIGSLPMDVDNKALMEICASALSCGGDNVEIERASVIRLKSFETKAEDLERFTQGLVSHIQDKTLLLADQFTLRVNEPRNNGDFEYRATMTISDANYADRATELLSRKVHLKIGGEPVKFVGDTREEVTIPTRIFHVIEDELTRLQDHVRQTVPTTELKVEKLKSGRIVGRIRSTRYTYALRVRGLLHDAMRGDVIDCSTPLLDVLFKETGIKFLEKLEKEHRVYVQPSFLRRQVVFYGSTEEITKSKLSLNGFLETLDRRGVGQTRQLFVKPPTYPAAVLKTFLAQNGYNLDRIVAEIPDCLNLKIDPIKRRLDYTGSEDGFRRLETMLRNVAADLPPVDGTTDADVPECAACLCPVEPKKLYCLETCGHYYCNECILSQLQNAVRDRRYPIMCAQDGCEKPFVIKDLSAVLRLVSSAGATNDRRRQDNQDRQQAKVDWEPLIDSSLEAYLAKHKDIYSHCTTPECHGVYQKTADPQLFLCESCGAKICSRCGLEFHAGETCEAYAAMKRDSNVGLKKWYAEDPENRKPCPKCNTPIEKNGGCMHMECTSCHVHLCWRCMAMFSNDSDTYGHLRDVHGTFM